MSKEMWIEEYERVGDEYPHDMSKEEALARLKDLGIDREEAEEMLAMLTE